MLVKFGGSYTSTIFEKFAWGELQLDVQSFKSTGWAGLKCEANNFIFNTGDVIIKKTFMPAVLISLASEIRLLLYHVFTPEILISHAV